MERTTSRKWTKRAALGASALLGITAVLTLLVGRSAPATPVCTKTWSGAGGNSLWSTPGNWSPSGVPGTADDVCVGTGGPAGSYSVVFQGSSTIDALTVGGGSAGTTQTVVVAGGGYNGGPNVGNADLGLNGVTTTSQTLANGALVLDSQDGNGYAMVSAAAGVPAFVNAGLLQTLDPANIRYLRMNIHNVAGGAILVAGTDTRVDNATTLDNSGSFTVSPTAHIAVSGGSTVTNTAGTLTNNGFFQVNGATFVQGGTIASGGANPIHLEGSNLTFTGTGAGTWDIQRTVNLSGNTFSGQTVRVIGGTDTGANAAFGNEGNAVAAMSSSNTWGGTVVLDSGDGNGYADISGSGTQTITSGGALKSQQTAGNIRYIETNIVNQAGGSLSVGGADTRIDTATTVVNSGSFLVTATAQLTMSANSTVTDTAGTLTNNGLFQVNGANFVQSGTNASGGANPVHLEGSNLSFIGSGAGTWDLQRSDTLSGSMSSGQTVRVMGGTDTGANAAFLNEGNATASIASSNTWGGTVVLDSGDGNGYANIIGPGTQTIASGGTLKTLQTAANTRYIETNIVNNAGGVVNLAGSDTRLDNADTLNNSGSFVVSSTAQFTVSANSRVTDTAGTLTNNGLFQVAGANFVQAGTNASGGAHPIHVESSTLTFSGPGAGAWDLQRSDTLSGSMSSGQTLRAMGGTDTGANAVFGNEGNASVSVAGSNLWGGTVVLDSGDGAGYAFIFGPGTQTVASGGTLKTLQTGGNTRYIETNIVNSAGGVVNVAGSDTRFDAANTLNNSGSFVVSSTAQFAVSANSTVTDTAGTLTNNGLFQVAGGHFVQGNTNASGGANPVHVESSTLTFTGSGPGSWDLQRTNTLSGSMVVSQTVRVMGGTDNGANAAFGNEGNGFTSVSGSNTWGGTVVLDSVDGNGYALVNGSGTQTVAAGGLLETLQTGGAVRYIETNIKVAAGGRATLAATPTSFDAGTTFVNAGTLLVPSPDAAAFTAGSTFSQDPSGTGTVVLQVGGATSASLVSSPSPTTLGAGTLEADTSGGFMPAVGSSHTVMTGTPVNGTFSQLIESGAFFRVDYPGSVVNLVTIPSSPGSLGGISTFPTTATVAVFPGLPGDVYGATATLDFGDGTTGTATASTDATNTVTVPIPAHTYATAGTFHLTVTVPGSTAASQVTLPVTISQAVAPTFTADTPPVTATVATPYSYTFKASGNPAPTFTVTSGTLPVGLSLNATTGVLSGTPTTAGAVTFTVKASNGVAPPAVTPSIRINVLSPPAFTADTPPVTATVGIPYSYTFTATGNPAPTFTVVSGSVPAGLTLTATTGVLSGTPTTAGSVTFTVRASNGVGSPAVTPVITINVLSPPAFTGDTPPVTATVGVPYSYTFKATGNPAPTFTVVSGSLPAGLTLTATTGVLSGTPTTAGSVTFTVRAANGVGSPAVTPVITINVLSPPAFTGDTPPVTATVGVAYSYTFKATGNPAPTFTVSTGSLPAGLTLTATTGVLSGTPTTAGSVTFTVRAANGVGSPAVTPVITINVLSPPAFTADTPPVTATVGTPYSYTFVATGNPAPTFAVASGSIPAGLTLTATTGVLSGTPTTAGSVTFTVRAANGVGSPAVTPVLTINVLAAPVFTADTPPSNAMVGTPYSYTFKATGNPAPTFGLASGSLPGLTLTATSGVLSGTPTTAGSVTFTVRASNGVNPAAVTPVITINVIFPPSFTADTPPVTATAGTPYSYTFAAKGSPAPTFTVTSGTLPTGLGLTATTGVLAGTPTTAGVVTFTVTASNGVPPPAVTPVITITVSAGPPSKLALTTPAITATATSSPTIGPVTVAEQDAFGNAVKAPAGGTTTTLTSSSAKGVFSATSGGAVTTTVSIPPGSSSTTFFYGDTLAGTPTVTATATGLSPAVQKETINHGPATRLAFTSSAFTSPVTASPTVGPLTLREQDGFANPVNAPAGGKKVTLFSSSGHGMFSATSGGAVTTTVTIPAGSSSTGFFYGDSSFGTPTIVALAAGLKGDSQVETMTYGSATQLAITSAAVSGTATPSPTLGPITVTLENAAGAPLTAVGNITVSVFSSSGTGVFAATSGGAATTTFTIAAGTSSATFFYGDTTSGTPTIGVATSGLAGDTQVETIT